MAFLQREFLPSNDTNKTKTSALHFCFTLSTLLLYTLYTWQRKRHAFRARRNGFFGGEFSVSNIREDAAGKVMFISQTTDFHFANYRFSFRKLQIPISQTTDSHFANYRFSFRKLQILISQTTDFHVANYRFSFRKLQISISQTTDFHFVSSHFVSQTTVSLYLTLTASQKKDHDADYLQWSFIFFCVFSTKWLYN